MIDKHKAQKELNRKIEQRSKYLTLEQQYARVKKKYRY